MNDLVIEKGIQPPENFSESEKFRRAFAAMDDGDSFVVSCYSDRQLVTQVAKRSGVKVRTQSIANGEFRVWKIGSRDVNK